MKFKPETLVHRVIIKPFIEKESKGGILIARDERSQAINTDRGEIYLIGPSCWFDKPSKPDLQPGDKVYYSKYGAKLLKDEDTGEMFILCNDEDILVGYSDE